MRVEQRPHRPAHPRGLVQRVLDVEVRHRAARVPRLGRVELELAERQGKPFAVAGDLGCGRVREVLPASRDGELDQHGGDRREGERGEAEREGDQPRGAAALPAAAEDRDPEEEVGEERDDADQDGDERHQADVAVADVRELVRDHAFELALVHQVEQAGRHADVGGVEAAAGRERVRRRVVDDVDRRRLRQPCSERHGLDNVVEPRVLRPVGRLCAGGARDDLPGRDPAEDPVDDPDDADDDQQRRPEGVGEDHPDHADEHCEEKEQPERAPAVGADLLLQRHTRSGAGKAGASALCEPPSNLRLMLRRS